MYVCLCGFLWFPVSLCVWFQFVATNKRKKGRGGERGCVQWYQRYGLEENIKEKTAVLRCRYSEGCGNDRQRVGREEVIYNYKPWVMVLGNLVWYKKTKERKTHVCHWTSLSNALKHHGMLFCPKQEVTWPPWLHLPSDPCCPTRCLRANGRKGVFIGKK